MQTEKFKTYFSKNLLNDKGNVTTKPEVIL